MAKNTRHSELVSESQNIEAPYELVVKMTSYHFYLSSFHFALQNKNSRIYC